MTNEKVLDPLQASLRKWQSSVTQPYSTISMQYENINKNHLFFTVL